MQKIGGLDWDVDELTDLHCDSNAAMRSKLEELPLAMSSANRLLDHMEGSDA